MSAGEDDVAGGESKADAAAGVDGLSRTPEAEEIFELEAGDLSTLY